MENKKIIPFDLKRALKDKDVKLKTRGGEDAKIICYVARNEKRIIALVDFGNGEIPFQYFDNGRHYVDSDCNLDLVLEVPCVKLPRRMTNKELAEWLRNSTNDNVREMIEINPNVGNYITGSYIYEDEEDFLEVPENIRIRENFGDFFEPIVKEAIKWE